MSTVIDPAFDPSILTCPGIYSSSQALLTRVSLTSAEAAARKTPRSPPSLAAPPEAVRFSTVAWPLRVTVLRAAPPGMRW